MMGKYKRTGTTKRSGENNRGGSASIVIFCNGETNPDVKIRLSIAKIQAIRYELGDMPAGYVPRERHHRDVADALDVLTLSQGHGEGEVKRRAAGWV